MAKHYSIYEAKAKLSEVLRIVKDGTPVIVTERGKAIARISPVQSPDTFSQHYQNLVDLGAIQKRTAKHFPEGKPVKGALKRFLAERE